MDNNHLYHSLLAELYANHDPSKQKIHLNKALDLAKSENEKTLLRRKLLSLDQ